jgi:hypothetical protein
LPKTERKLEMALRDWQANYDVPFLYKGEDYLTLLQESRLAKDRRGVIGTTSSPSLMTCRYQSTTKIDSSNTSKTPTSNGFKDHANERGFGGEVKSSTSSNSNESYRNEGHTP